MRSSCAQKKYSAADLRFSSTPFWSRPRCSRFRSSGARSRGRHCAWRKVRRWARRHTASNRDSEATFGVLRQIVCNYIPRRAIHDEGVGLRTNSGIIVERAHANGDLFAFRPIASEQTRTAIHTERFHRAFTFTINFDQLFALQETEVLAQNPRLGAYRSAGMFPAAIAMAVIGLYKRRFNFEPHPAA